MSDPSAEMLALARDIRVGERAAHGVPCWCSGGIPCPPHRAIALALDAAVAERDKQWGIVLESAEAGHSAVIAAKDAAMRDTLAYLARPPRSGSNEHALVESVGAALALTPDARRHTRSSGSGAEDRVEALYPRATAEVRPITAAIRQATS